MDQVKWDFPNRGIVSFGHIHYLDLVESGLVTPAFHQSAFKFTVVREPLDRAVSLFEYLQAIRVLPRELTFEVFSVLLREQCFEPIGLYNARGLSQCNPQVAWITDDTGALIVDEVGRFENIQPFFESLRERGIVTGQLPEINVSRSRRPTADYYSSKSVIENIEACYAADFELLGY